MTRLAGALLALGLCAAAPACDKDGDKADRADVVLAGPHHGVLRLAVVSGIGAGRLELGDGQIPSLQGVDTLPREAECRFHGVRSCVDTPGYIATSASAPRTTIPFLVPPLKLLM